MTCLKKVESGRSSDHGCQCVCKHHEGEHHEHQVRHFRRKLVLILTARECEGVEHERRQIANIGSTVLRGGMPFSRWKRACPSMTKDREEPSRHSARGDQRGRRPLLNQRDMQAHEKATASIYCKTRDGCLVFSLVVRAWRRDMDEEAINGGRGWCSLPQFRTTSLLTSLGPSWTGRLMLDQCLKCLNQSL